jgi:hypothetical protein
MGRGGVMKLTAKQYKTETTIETEHDDVSAFDFITIFVRPMMFALGYAPKSVEDALNEEEK